MKVLDLACNKRSAQSIRRHLAELCVRQCEATLKNLQQALHDADVDLQETDNNIGRLRGLVSPARNAKTHIYTTLYDSNVSSGSCSSCDLE